MGMVSEYYERHAALTQNTKRGRSAGEQGPLFVTRKKASRPSAAPRWEANGRSGRVIWGGNPCKKKSTMLRPPHFCLPRDSAQDARRRSQRHGTERDSRLRVPKDRPREAGRGGGCGFHGEKTANGQSGHDCCFFVTGQVADLQPQLQPLALL